MSTAKRPDPITIGWREWVSLPTWEVAHLKAKIDTGARTSSLHAFGLEWFDRDGNPWVRFEIHPWQRSTADAVIAETAVVATRDIRSSSGEVEHRPVVHTSLVLAGRTVTAEVTLTRRDEMGFRMLVGREALRRRFVVDPSVSYLGGRPDKSVRRRNRGETESETAPDASPQPSRQPSATLTRQPAKPSKPSSRSSRSTRQPSSAPRSST